MEKLVSENQFQINEASHLKENERATLWKFKCQECNEQPNLKNNKKPYFSDKGSNSNQVTLLENKPLLTDDKDIAKTMNNFFINITKNLNLKPYKDYSLTDIIEISSNFDNHISKKKIKQSFPNIASGDFNFQGVSMEEVKKKKNWM